MTVWLIVFGAWLLLKAGRIPQKKMQILYICIGFLGIGLLCFAACGRHYLAEQLLGYY